MNVTLYKSATCPQCKIAKMKLDEKGIPYTEIYVEELDAAALDAAGVKGIPTLIVDDTKITSIRDISQWINAQEVSNG